MSEDTQPTSTPIPYNSPLARKLRLLNIFFQHTPGRISAKRRRADELLLKFAVSLGEGQRAEFLELVALHRSLVHLANRVPPLPAAVRDVDDAPPSQQEPA